MVAAETPATPATPTPGDRADSLGEWTIAADPQEVPDARYQIRTLCKKRFGYLEALGDIELVAGEVLNNAVEHTSTADGVACEVHVAVAAVGGHTVRVEVTDDGRSGKDPAVRENRDETGGFGLLLVDAFATTWGAVRDETGRLTVWFEVKIQ